MHNEIRSLESDAAARSEPGPSTPAATVFEGIARRLCLLAVYNGVAITIAPHIVYTKREGLFIDAVTVARDGNPPKEIKIGAFKLAGLSAIELTPRPFLPHRGFNPGDPKYVDATVFAL